jgi:hypothetical protein
MNCIAEIKNQIAKHSYEVFVSKQDYIKVDANNRAQAAKIVGKLGHSVCSVNMVG